MEQNIESKHSIIAEYYTECYAELKGFVASRLLGMKSRAGRRYRAECFRALVEDGLYDYTYYFTLSGIYYSTQSYSGLLASQALSGKYEYVVRNTDWQNRYVDDVATIYSAHEIQAKLEMVLHNFQRSKVVSIG